jgi:hypothetical protein
VIVMTKAIATRQMKIHRFMPATVGARDARVGHGLVPNL